MKIEKDIPREFPNIYFNDIKVSSRDEKGVPHYEDFLRVILWLYTPSGKISKYYQSIKLNLAHPKFYNMGNRELLDYAYCECMNEAHRAYKSEIRKGYTVGDVYIHGYHTEGGYSKNNNKD